jgi:hypothetical protein
MDFGKELLIKQFNQLKGQYVLINRKVLRFIGIGEDSDDYIYIMWDGNNLSFHSGLSNIIQLKDKINKNDYLELIRMSKINHSDSLHAFLPETPKAIDLISKSAKKVKENALNNICNINKIILFDNLCWEMN